MKCSHSRPTFSWLLTPDYWLLYFHSRPMPYELNRGFCLIPIELRLTNFMSYKHMDEPLSFSSMHTAVLCGPNGHGKSSLLDAITWALWGRARGVDKRGSGTDDLIHRKEAHMQVEFSFELEGQLYRVIRARQRKGKAGTSRLEFQLISGEDIKSLTGETLSATQEAINKTLRMDYETFVNSAFIMQGHADNFMTRSANERKEILSEILGLSVYDELEEMARERRKLLNDKLRDIDNRYLHIDQELEHLPLYEEELKSAEKELKNIRARIKKEDERLTKLREEKAVYDMKAAGLAELNGRCAQAELDIQSIDEQIKTIEESTNKARELVKRRDEIEMAYLELTGLRKKEEELSKSSQVHGALERQMDAVKYSIEQARSALETDLNHLSQRKSELEKDLSQRSSVEAAFNSNKEKLAVLERLEQDIEELREKYSGLQQKKGALESRVEADEAKLADLQKRRGLLSDGDACPLCKKPMADHDRQRINKEFDQEISDLKSRISKARSEALSLTGELEAITNKGKALSEKVKSKGKLQVENGKFAEQIKSFDKAAAEITSLNKRISELTLKLAQRLYAPDDQEKLSKLSSELEKTAYSPDEHLRVKQRLKELVIYDQLKANLENAQSSIKIGESTTKTLAAQRDAKVKALKEDEGKAGRLAEELATFKNIEENLKLAEGSLSDIRREESFVVDKRSAAQANIDNCKKLLKQKDELSRNRKDVAKEVEIFDKLAFAFSKKGIQALIIENTIPEIEEEANSLLHRLTNGQMSLRFVTQKDQRKGGVVETLDLLIADGDGDRKYELFSGGEAFRINFAVRIALSKLLARRSGARLETLVVDEGFGTQDEEGKERLIEAISAIQNDFKKIIVITHLEDLKEIFPARIEVVKKRGVGSVVSVI